MRARSAGRGVGVVLVAGGAVSSCAVIADLDNTYELTGGGGRVDASSTGGASSGGGGGSGGAGGTAGPGGGGGLGGMGGSGVVFEWTAVDPTQGMAGSSECAKYVYALPAWLAFESPTPARSSQISDAALCVGFASNEPRARNVAPVGLAKWGLSVESSRTNDVLQSDSWQIPVSPNGWLSSQNDPTLDLKVATSEPDPNVVGVDNATKFSSTMLPPPSGQHSRYFLTSARVVSTWVRGEGNPSLGCTNPLSMQSELCYAHFRHKLLPGLYVNVTSNVWRRLSIAHAKAESDAILFETRDVPSGAGVVSPPVSFVAYGAQAEPTGAYPSSYIRTEGVAVTRAAEKLYATSTDTLLPGGFFKVTMKVAPNFNVNESLNEQSANEYHLLYLQLNSRLYLDRNDRTLRLTMAGSSVVSDPLAFSREQELTITVENKSGAPLKLSVEGATEGNGEWTGDTAQPIASEKTLGILSRDSGAEECADLRYIRFE